MSNWKNGGVFDCDVIVRSKFYISKSGSLEWEDLVRRYIFRICWYVIDSYDVEWDYLDEEIRVSLRIGLKYYIYR